MKKLLLAGIVVGVGIAPHAFAQNAAATINSPLYTPGVQALSQTLQGGLRTSTQDGLLSTYTAAANWVPPLGLAVQICGSASKSVKIRSIYINGVATTAGGMTVTARRLSAADTGGTGTLLAMVPALSTNAVATSSVEDYTAVPTGGTSLGHIFDGFLAFPLVAAAGPGVYIATPSDSAAQPITLNGTAQCVDIQLGGTLPTGPSASLAVTVTEQ